MRIRTNMNSKFRVLQIFNLFRLIPVWLIICAQSKKKKEIIFDEIEYWNKCAQLGCNGKFNIFSLLLIKLKEYRSLLYYRCGGGQNFNKGTFPTHGIFIY